MGVHRLQQLMDHCLNLDGRQGDILTWISTQTLKEMRPETTRGCAGSARALYIVLHAVQGRRVGEMGTAGVKGRLISSLGCHPLCEC